MAILYRPLYDDVHGHRAVSLFVLSVSRTQGRAGKPLGGFWIGIGLVRERCGLWDVSRRERKDDGM